MQNNITIPLELLDGRYSLSEIATMTILFASPHFSEKTREYWSEDETCNRVTEQLIEEGIIQFHEDKIEIDIQQKAPMNKIDEIENILINSNLNRDTIDQVLNLVELISQVSQNPEEFKIEPYGKKKTIDKHKNSVKLIPSKESS